MTDLTDFQREHLILLVGSNPLPNYVAAKMLCPTGTLYLLHSIATERFARKLEGKLGRERCILKDLGTAETSPEKVYQATQTMLNKIPNDARAGLDYTGGTKVMSVHTYRAVLENTQAAVQTSYLDARTLEMVITGQGSTPDSRFFVGNKIEISVEELMKLHDIILEHPPKTEPKFINVCQTLVEIHQDQTERQAWREWCNVSLRRSDEARTMVFADEEKAKGGDQRSHHWQDIAKKATDWKSDGKLKQVTLPETGKLARVREAFAAELPTISAFNLKQLADESDSFSSKKIQKFAKWLDGEWLDHYTLWTLCQLQKDGYKLYKPGMDYEKEEPKFQFDVGITRGYQLFAFSCTTDDSRGLCKSKLFEAYIRAQQMGGEEAKTALICCYDDPDALEQQMALEFNAQDRIKVFGLADLPGLKDGLKGWFDQIDTRQGSG